MTRKKQTNKAAVEFLDNQPQGYFKTKSERNTAHTGFILGARWADEHPRWFKPSESLPQKEHEEDLYQKVLISQDGYVREAEYCFKYGKFEVYHVGDESTDYITPDYWMPLPASPTKED